MSELDKKEKIIMSIVYGLIALSSIVIFFVIYNIIQKEKPQTLGTVYAGTLTCTEEDINIIEVKIHSNENRNGISCYEVLFNGYADYKGTAVKGFGMQSVSYKYFDGYAYNTDDLGQSSYKASGYPNELYFDIDGKFYKYQFEKYGVEEIKKGSNAFMTELNILFNRTETVYYSYNYIDLFKFICGSAATDSAKYEYGEFSIPLLDLSKYVKVLYQGEDTQYHPLPETSTMYEFFKVKITYSKDGMTEASQSLFKQFRYSPSWNFYSNTDIENYWNAYADIKLNEKHLNYVYNEERELYYATIDETFANYLKGLSKSNKIINLDLTNLDFEVYGIDLMNFKFNIQEFNIKVNSVEDFVVYNQFQCSVTPTIKAV